MFRLISPSGPAVTDFVPVVLIQGDSRFGIYACKNCGLSVFTEYKHARRLAKSVKKFRAVVVAVGTIQPESGVVLATRESDSLWSHHTWWTEAGYDPSAEFRVVD